MPAPEAVHPQVALGRFLLRQHWALGLQRRGSPEGKRRTLTWNCCLDWGCRGTGSQNQAEGAIGGRGGSLGHNPLEAVGWAAVTQGWDMILCDGCPGVGMVPMGGYVPRMEMTLWA